MERFSFIVPTAGRTSEFGRLIESLVAQNRRDIQLIVVDQNEDDRLVPYLESVGGAFSVIHLKAPKKGPSNARNIGLQSASGEIVAFPDDDCWYPSNLLQHVDEWFKQQIQFDILSIGAEDGYGQRSGNRWFQDACDITPVNSLRTTFCNSLFFRSGSLPANVRFDESLFPGEETDLVLRLLSAGHRGRFDRTWHVGHPRRDMLSGTVSSQRAILYGESMGKLARKHGLYFLWLALLTYDLLRGIAVTLTGRPGPASYCFAHALGILKGIWEIPKERKEAKTSGVKGTGSVSETVHSSLFAHLPETEFPTLREATGSLPSPPNKTSIT